MSTTAAVFLLGYTGLLFLALFRSPLWGLYAYVATFYLHPVDRWWSAGLPDLRWSLLAAAVTCVAVLLRPAVLDPGRRSWLAFAGAKVLLLYTVWLWIQLPWAFLFDEHLEVAILFTKYLVLFYLIYTLVRSDEDLYRFSLAHVLGCAYLGILVLAAPAQGRLEGVGGPGINEANALGMQLGTGLLFAAALVAKAPVWMRLAALFSIPLMANGVVQTESRGAFLAIVMGAGAMFILSQRQFRKYWYVFGILALMLAVRFAPEHYWERIVTIFDTVETPQEADGSTQGRLALIPAQWQMFKDHPLGAGHRGTAYLSPRYLPQEYLTRSKNDPSSRLARSSHNTFMTTLVEQGLPGAVLFLVLCLWMARSALELARLGREQPPDRQTLFHVAVGGALACVLVAGVFVDYLKAEIQVWCIALLAVLLERHRARQEVGAPVGDTVSTPDAVRTA